MPLLWADPITENPILGSTEIWEIFNFTEDAHPIHLHLVQFQVVDRQPSLFELLSRIPAQMGGGGTDVFI
jgi:bilirubin oxidase